MEGDNITLLCRAYISPSPPKWTYFDLPSGQMKPVNLTHIPRGRINIIYDLHVKITQDSVPILELTGVRIETESVKITGEEFPVFKSRLFLTNIGIATPTKFGCMANDAEDKNKIHEDQVSFNVNGTSSNAKRLLSQLKTI